MANGAKRVFSYRHLPFARYALVQIVLFPLLALAALVYFQWFSKWRGGFFHVTAAYVPVLVFLFFFLTIALLQPIRDLLTVRNERIEIEGEVISFFNLFGRRKLRARMDSVELVRAGKPMTSKTQRFVFQVEGRGFFFSAEISGCEELLRLLRVELPR